MPSRRYRPTQLLALALALATLSTTALAADRAEIQLLIQQAQEKQEQARRLEHAWTVTDDYVAEAQTALEANEFEAATTAAKRALKTASASLQQAADESLAWRARLP